MMATLPTLLQPKTLPIKADQMGPPQPSPVEQAQSRVSDIERQLGLARGQQAEFQAEEGMMKAGQAVKRAEGMAAATSAERQAIETSEPFKKTEDVEREMMGAYFQPTQRSAQENAALFSLINVLGFFIGRGGKQSATQALSAMNGMLEGKQAGDSQRFKEEKIKFDTNLKALSNKYSMLSSQLKKVADLAARDKQAAAQELDVILAQEQADFLKAHISKVGLPKTIAELENARKGAERALGIAEQNERRAEDKRREAEERRQRELDRQAFQLKLEGVRQAGRQSLMDQRMEAAADKAAKSTVAEKPPAKEVVAQNQLRNTLIPKIEQAIPVLDRINKEGNWNEMTVALAVDPRYAEYVFRDDPEALNLILTLAYFRSKEFETAGKALTKKEDQILAPIVRGDLRVYEGIRNAMSEGVKTLRAEQRGLEQTYPYLKKFNEAYRQDLGLGGGAPEAGGANVEEERSRAKAAIAAGKDEDAVKARFKERTGQEL